MRNAANASPQGGVVDVKVRVHATEVVFIVIDDGPGVAPEIADYMFEPFASTTHEGTGLGLAISAYVMQLLGGRISYRQDRRPRRLLHGLATASRSEERRLQRRRSHERRRLASRPAEPLGSFGSRAPSESTDSTRAARA